MHGAGMKMFTAADSTIALPHAVTVYPRYSRHKTLHGVIT
jgi:hypothetical protein